MLYNFIHWEKKQKIVSHWYCRGWACPEGNFSFQSPETFTTKIDKKYSKCQRRRNKWRIFKLSENWPFIGGNINWSSQKISLIPIKKSLRNNICTNGFQIPTIEPLHLWEKKHILPKLHKIVNSKGLTSERG